MKYEYTHSLISSNENLPGPLSTLADSKLDKMTWCLIRSGVTKVRAPLGITVKLRPPVWNLTLTHTNKKKIESIDAPNDP